MMDLPVRCYTNHDLNINMVLDKFTKEMHNVGAGFRIDDHTRHDSGSQGAPTKKNEQASSRISEQVGPYAALADSSHNPTPRMPSTLNDFEVINTIGTGSYGTCKKIRRKKDGKLLVWKELDYGSMSEGEKQMLVSEVNLLRELKHSSIVRYYDRIIDRSNSTIYIIMEYCEGGDLSTLISHCRKTGTYMDEEFVWKVLIQITQALSECHRRKNGKAVLHRDLKPANVFLDGDKNVKLGDFGLARVLHHETSFAQTFVGTPYYMSPELVNNLSYNEKSDIWALGCMMYELCALHPPFTAMNQIDLNRRIRNGEFARLPYRYSDDLNKIIKKMIIVEVVKRPSIEDILRDPLIVSHIPSKKEMDAPASVKSESCKVSVTKDLMKMKEELEIKQKKLNEREKELENREKLVRRREKEVKEKMERVEIEEKKYKELISRYKQEGGTQYKGRRINVQPLSPVLSDKFERMLHINRPLLDMNKLQQRRATFFSDHPSFAS